MQLIEIILNIYSKRIETFLITFKSTTLKYKFPINLMFEIVLKLTEIKTFVWILLILKHLILISNVGTWIRGLVFDPSIKVIPLG